jgi:hypothetical protein
MELVFLQMTTYFLPVALLKGLLIVERKMCIRASN